MANFGDQINLKLVPAIQLKISDAIETWFLSIMQKKEINLMKESLSLSDEIVSILISLSVKDEED